MSLSSEMIRPGAEDISPLQIRLFGRLSVYVHGNPLAPLHSRKSAWLLALLVLKQQQAVDRTWMAATLWPDSDHRESLQNLRNNLSMLRRALRPEHGRIKSPTPGTLQLDLTQADVDLTAFDAGVKHGGQDCLANAVALYHGPLLEGCEEEWVLLEREQRQQACLEALETLAQGELQAGAAAQASRRMQTVIGIDPFRETAQALLMTALAATGDYAAVTKVYRTFRLLLHDQLNTQPSAETTALYQKIRDTARHTAASGTAPLRAKCVSDQPKILSADAPRSDDAEPVGIAGVTHNLPLQVTSFIGREKERNEVRALLANSRLLTYIGAGGCGKTRLALEVAGEMVATYPEGVWLVELASLTDASRVARAAAAVLDVREQPGIPLVQTLMGALQSKTMLLLLDNCEHLLQGCSEFAALLLRGCPAVTILATSRERLGIGGEQTYRVPSLALPDLEAALTVEDVRQYESVRLFVERASLSRSGFQVNHHNAEAIAQVCHRLDGIPLAIELAAARIRSMPVEELQHRLDDRFQLLTGGDRSALPRQQTLRGLIDWSYDLLTEPERLLLQQSSVFVGGWRLEAAETVCGEGVEVLDLLSSLVDKSLVMYDERAGQARYRLLETVRQYAAERLAELNEGTAVRDRHMNYCLSFAELAEPKLQGVDQADWLQRLEAEHENLRAALGWSLGQSTEVSSKRNEERGKPTALRFCVALQPFWQTRGHLKEAREWCDRALAASTGYERTKERIRVLNGVGVVARMQCDFAAAQSHLEESLEICRELGDPGGLASSLLGLGNVAVSRSDNATARAYYQESLDVYRELGDRRGIAGSLIGLGIVASSQREFAAARGYYEESLTIMKGIGGPAGIARTLGNLGNAAFDQGDYASARAYYQESGDIEAGIGNRTGIAYSLGNLGNVAWSQGDYASAGDYYQRSLAIKKEIGDRSGIANTLINLGTMAMDQCDLDSAQAYFEQSLTIFCESGDRKGQTFALDAFAGLAAKTSRFEHATLLWGATEALREQVGSPRPPNEREQFERTSSEALQAIGPERFNSAWARGHGINLDELLAVVLGRTGF